MGEMYPPTTADYAMEAADNARRETERLRREMQNKSGNISIEFSDDELKRLAGFVVDKLIDAVADGYCVIDTTGNYQETVQDHLVQLARSIQNNRKKT